MKFKLEQFLFYFLFFAIPLQTRKILYSPGWYYNEWQSVSVYFTDLLLLALFLFWLANSYSKLLYYVSSIKYYGTNLKYLIHNTKFLILKPDFFLVLFLIAALVSVKNSSDLFIGGFLWLKLVEFALFYFYLKTYAICKFDFVKVLYVLLLGGTFQAIIAIVQFLKQGDLGLRWLGESVLGPHMTGVASFFVSSGLPAEALAKAGEKIMRAYGTTPHPNVLAAYLFLAIVAFYFVVFYAKPKYYDSLMYHSAIYAAHGIMLFGLFFTFSRTIIFLFFLNFFARGFLINFVKKFKTEFLTKSFVKQKILPIFLMTVVVTAAFAFLYWPEVSSRMTLSLEEEAVQLRVFYNEESLKGGINLFGIGLGDFTGWLMEQNPNLPSYVYQPVHNIYLLLYSETGLLGVSMFLLFLFFLLKNSFSKKVVSCWLLVVGFLFMGLFDHFLLTIQQGRFIFWLSLALLGALASSLNKHSSENDPS